MAYHPFQNNSKYTQLFKVRSNSTRCDHEEVAELYKVKESISPSEFVLFRYILKDSQVPERCLIKFTDILSIEVETATGACSTNTYLYLTTVHQGMYGSSVNKFTAACGTLNYILNLEKELYKHLL
jgi:hypothetical protein